MKTVLVAALSGAFLLAFAQFASAQDKPTDPQIAHIAYTAGVIDIEAAKLAISKSKNSEVVDHEAVNVQALDLVKKLNVTPEDNPTSQALTKAAEEKRTTLGKLEGAASTKPMSTMRSPITSRSTARWKHCLSRQLRTPNSRGCWKPGSSFSRATSSTPSTWRPA